MRTFGSTPADVVMQQNGQPAQGARLTVWTAKNGIRITELLDVDGQPLPNAHVESGINGQFAFRLNSDTWADVWVQDPSANWYHCVAAETITNAAVAGEEFPEMRDQFDHLSAALSIPTDAVPDDVTAAAITTAAINTALKSGNVFLPAGEWWINGPIRIPSYRQLYGAGIGLTKLRMINGASYNDPCVTNIGNTLTPHTTPDTHIYLADMTIDANWTNRAAGTSINESGSAVQFACVEHALIERVYARNGHHSFDITASMYRNDGPTEYAEGPSRWVTIRNCIGGASYDDAFTSHHSQFIRITDCVALEDSGVWRAGYSHGFEVDDGSQDVQVVRCYSYGFDEGFQVKAHPTAPPARRVTLLDCVADTTRVGYDIQAAVPDDAELPDDYIVDADVRVIRCEARNIQITAGEPGQQQCSLRIIGYHDVHVEDFLCRDSPEGYLPISKGASDITLKNIVSENSWTTPTWTSTVGVIHIGDDAGGNIKINNVRLRATPIAAPIITVGAAQRVQIDGVTGTGASDTNSAVMFLNGYDPDNSVEDVETSGWANDISIAGKAGYVGTYSRRVWQQIGNGALSATSSLASYPLGHSMMVLSGAQATAGQWPSGGMVVTYSRGDMGRQFCYPNSRTGAIQTRTYGSGAWGAWYTLDQTAVS